MCILKKSYIIVNRVLGELAGEARSFVEKLGVPLLGTIPADAELSAFDATGRPLVELGDDSPVYQSVSQMLKQIL